VQPTRRSMLSWVPPALRAGVRKIPRIASRALHCTLVH
jgi:hypothetical protein